MDELARVEASLYEEGIVDDQFTQLRVSFIEKC